MAKRNYQGVNADEVEQLLESDDFIHREKCGCDYPIHTFRLPGESVEGRLRPCKSWDRADRARTAEIHYHTATGQDAAIAIRLSKLLWKTINENHIWGQWVRITYQGSVRGKFPNAMKVYLVEVDKGSITPKYERVNDGSRKNPKPRAKKPIRRPGAAAAAT